MSALPVGLKRDRRRGYPSRRPQAQSAACRHGEAGARTPVGPMRDRRRGCKRKRVRRPSRPQAQSAACRHGEAGARPPQSAPCAISGAAASGSGYADPAGLKRNRRHAGMGKRAHAPRRPHARLAARLRAEVNVRPSSQPHGRSAARLPFQSATCTICGAAACGSGRGKRSSARCASKSADEFRPRWAGPERAFNGRGCRRRLQYAKSRGSVRGSAYKRTRGRIPRRSFRAWRARRAGAVRCRR